MTHAADGTGRPAPGGKLPHITDAERVILDTLSGTAPRPEALEAAVQNTKRLRAETPMPDVPYIEDVIATLHAAGQNTESVMVAAFVNNAIIEVPGTEESFTVRRWLEDGHPPDLVHRLADQMKYSS